MLDTRTARRRIAALVAIVAVLGVSNAQAVDPYAAGNTAVRNAVRTFTQQEILQMYGGGTASRGVSWGRYVPYIGTAVAGTALIVGALDWFYDEAQRSTNGLLDGWWNDADPNIAQPSGWCTSVQLGWRRLACNSTYLAEWSKAYGLVGTSTYGGWPQCRYSYGNSVTCGIFRSSTAVLWGPLYFNSSTPEWLHRENPEHPVWEEIAQERWDAWLAASGVSAQQPFSDFLQGNPSATDEVRDVVDEYLQNEIAQGRMPFTFADPATGITLQPVPSANQYGDSPFIEATVDSDGDGWPDWFEIRVGSDPSNPNSSPLPEGDPDGDGWTNEQERLAATDPADPSSRPNPDGTGTDTDGDGLDDSVTVDDLAELFAELAREATLREAADSLATIEGVLSDPLGSIDAVTLPDLDVSPIEQLDLPGIDPGLWVAARTRVEERTEELRLLAEDRFPFAMAAWVPSAPNVQTAECPSITLEYSNTQAPFSVCGTQADAFLIGLRPLLVAGFYLTAVLGLIGFAMRASG